MSDIGWYKYSARVASMTLLADTGDIFNLEGNGTRPYRVLEARIWQSGTTALTMNSLAFRRGVIVTAAGTAVTEKKYTTDGPAAVCVARSLPTTDVATDDWDYGMGWNLLQEVVWLPTPEVYLPCNGAQDFGISQVEGIAHTKVGVQLVWEEYVGG